jgi:hypothetical protein
MKLPVPRLTVRRMMVAVAITAVAFEAESWRRRYPYCQSRAARCVEIERSHLWMADSHEKISALYRKRAADPRESARFNNEQAAIFARAARGERAKAKRAADRAQVYRRAALYPWLAIAPVVDESAGFSPPGRGERDEQASHIK